MEKPDAGLDGSEFTTNSQSYKEATGLSSSLQEDVQYDVPFQIFGSRALVELLARFSICSAAQSTSVLKSFANDWQTVRHNPMVCKAHEGS